MAYSECLLYKFNDCTGRIEKQRVSEGSLTKICNPNLLSFCLFKVFWINRSDHEMQRGTKADQASHGVHGVVVNERGWVNGPRWHYSHQLRNRQSLGFYQGLSLRQVSAKCFLKRCWIDFG